MDPTQAFCDNPDCPARGQVGKGTIKVHSHKEQRFRCLRCHQTFAASKGTPFYRLHKDRSLFVLVITLLTHGCPQQAVVAAFGLDERTVADWYAKSGSHSQGVHSHSLSRQPPDLGHVRPTSCTPSAKAGAAGWPWPWRCPHGCGWAGSVARCATSS